MEQHPGPFRANEAMIYPSYRDIGQCNKTGRRINESNLNQPQSISTSLDDSLRALLCGKIQGIACDNVIKTENEVIKNELSDIKDDMKVILNLLMSSIKLGDKNNSAIKASHEDIVKKISRENDLLKAEVTRLKKTAIETENKLLNIHKYFDNALGNLNYNIQKCLKSINDCNFITKFLFLEINKFKSENVLRVNKNNFDEDNDKHDDHTQILNKNNGDLEDILYFFVNLIIPHEPDKDDVQICCKSKNIVIRFKEKEMFDNWIKSARDRKNSYEELTYKELMELENSQAVPNKVPFECTICITECNPGDGVVLRDCLHSFCRQCLAHTVEFSEDIEVKCPFISDDYTCSSTLQEREIKHIVTPEVYERHLAKGLAITENKIQNSFHCKTADCPGWCIIEDEGVPENVNIFNCPVCNSQNCVPCQAIHPGHDCKEYQEYLIIQAETDPKAKKTLEYLKKLKDQKRAMNCPTCNVIVIKADGCDWLQCSMCKTDICWATLGPRWGPLGRGDTSGGCRCNFNMGMLCHPNCRNCH